uniref:acid phosphatase n=1 Tax=Panagrolaimus superbus TaxID=310955 RepID=A0A914Z6R2_9BILA
MPIPAWIKNAMEEFERLFVNYTLTLYGFLPFKTPQINNLQTELTKVSSGALMAEIYDRLSLKIKCQNSIITAAEFRTKECAEINSQKLYTYSTHDLTVVSLFAGLGFKSFLFEKYSMPAFGSTVTIELWKHSETNDKNNNQLLSEQNYYIKIYYYKNFYVKNPINLAEMLKPECTEKGCPFMYLKKRAELLRPQPDWKGMCSDRVPPTPTPTTTIRV